MPKSKNSKSRRKTQAKKSLAPKISSKKISKEAKAELKQFRRNVAALKKLGLAFTRTAPRKAKKSSRAQKILNQFESVLTKQAKAHKLGKGKTSPFAEMGYKTTPAHVIIPESEKAKVYARKGKLFRKTDMGGTVIKEEILPVPYKSLRQYIQWLKDTSQEAPEGKSFAFRLYGSNYYTTFQNTKLLAEYFETYDVVGWADNSSEEENEEVIENLSIITVEPGSGASRDRKRWSRSGQFQEVYLARRAYQYEKNKKRAPKKYSRMLEKQRERNKANYEATMADPKKREARNRKKRENYARKKGK